MRVFQAIGLYAAHLAARASLLPNDHVGAKAMLVEDRAAAPHILTGEADGDVRFEFINVAAAQNSWGRQHGLKAGTSWEDILLAQIEESGADIFYCMEPVWLDSSFVRRLPGCVKRSVAWRAAPLKGKDLSAYDLVVSNFPGINAQYERMGLRTAYFFPAVDDFMRALGGATDRPIDLLFIGSYTRHHQRRAKILERVADELSDRRVELHLDVTGAVSIAEHKLLTLAPLRRFRRPKTLRKCSKPPIFGLDYYQAMAKARVVLNAAIDMSGGDRGNIRCFEAMGLGAAMVSDVGDYPAGMEVDATMLAYVRDEDVVPTIRRLLDNEAHRRAVATAGFEMVHERYSKVRQWQAFQALPV